MTGDLSPAGEVAGRPAVVVLDYGSGNVRSVVRALERAGAQVTLSADSDQAIAADGLVVPGVGAFAACMAGLDAVGASAILRARFDAGRPVLGICVGMQVLYQSGIEHGIETAGLGVLAGRVEPLIAPVIPHIGWNTLAPPAGSLMFDGIADQRFYFVHSYAAHSTSVVNGETFTVHGESFVAAIESDWVWATQFHPEKSGEAGQRLLRNWLAQLTEGARFRRRMARSAERAPTFGVL